MSRWMMATPPLDEAREDLRLGVGDIVRRGEMRQMGRRHRRDERDMRLDHGHEWLDLARMIHADLEDAILGGGGQAGERERDAPMIVEGGPPKHGFRRHRS